MLGRSTVTGASRRLSRPSAHCTTVRDSIKLGAFRSIYACFTMFLKGCECIAQQSVS